MNLLTAVDAQAKETDDDISEILEQVNSLVKEKDKSDAGCTVEHIQKLLNKQLENLVWIDNKSGTSSFFAYLFFVQSNLVNFNAFFSLSFGFSNSNLIFF